MAHKIDILKQILCNHKAEKSLPRLITDLIYWIFKNRGGLYFFLLYRLYMKGKDPKEFLSVKTYCKLHEQVDPAYYRPMLEDKILFDRYIKGFSIPSPRLLGIAEQGSVFWVHEQSYVPLSELSHIDLHAYCKHVTSWGGKNIFKLDISQNRIFMDNKPATVAELTAKFAGGKYMLQETIGQHPDLDAINPNCINTIRVYTLFDGNEPRHFRSILRMGVGDSVVDNASGNNLACGIHSNHFLFDEALTRINIPRWYQAHPDSGVRFAEFKVPQHAASIELCCRAHRFFSNFMLIGWDVAVTPAGPVIIEGNPTADLILLQAIYGGLQEAYLAAARVANRVRNPN